MAPVCQGSGKSFDKIMSSTACACILKVRDTYFYFGSSLAATAGTAAAIYRSPAAMNLVIVGYQADSYFIIYFLSS